MKLFEKIIDMFFGKKIEEALKSCQGADIVTMSYPDPSDYEE